MFVTDSTRVFQHKFPFHILPSFDPSFFGLGFGMLWPGDQFVQDGYPHHPSYPFTENGGLVVPPSFFPGGEQGQGDESIHSKTTRIQELFPHHPPQLKAQVPVALVFELVHKVLDQGFFGKIELGAGPGQGQATQEDLFDRVARVALKASFWQHRHTTHTKQTFFGEYIAATTRTDMRKN